MKLLHTSDWHLGRSLYGRKRYAEFDAFLDWLADTIEQQEVDALLVAGDVFDTALPSNRAQAMYYRFLCRVASSRCRHVVVIAGNHDSPSFVDAPRALLKALDVHVVGQASASPEDEVLVLADARGEPELIVCAVPYLRDRDIRVVEAGESLEDKERKLVEGIRAHYANVVDAAMRRRTALGRADLPIVAMGHLFAAGGRTIEGDGVRDLYIGSLAHVHATIFPDSVDYVALGHLHVPQAVGGLAHVRYSGSPLPMGFGEATQQKSVCLVTLDPGPHRAAVSVMLMPVPVFQPLVRVQGDWETLVQQLAEHQRRNASAWLEVVYQGDALIGDLREQVESLVADTGMAVLRVKNSRVIDRLLAQRDAEESLDELDVHEVFERCLAAQQVPAAQWPELQRTYREAVVSLEQDDPLAQ